MLLPKMKSKRILIIKEIDEIIKKAENKTIPSDELLESLHILRCRLKNYYRLSTNDLKQWELKQ